MTKLKSASASRKHDSCKKFTDLICNYLADRLGPTLKREFERHLQMCPDCVNFLNTYKKTVSLTGTLSASELPAKVRANVLAFLRRKAHRIAALFFYLLSHVTG
ncbi:MAG: anti-sigma factor family protein [Candidatus Binatia bacterium]